MLDYVSNTYRPAASSRSREVSFGASMVFPVFGIGSPFYRMGVCRNQKNMAMVKIWMCSIMAEAEQLMRRILQVCRERHLKVEKTWNCQGNTGRSPELALAQGLAGFADLAVWQPEDRAPLGEWFEVCGPSGYMGVDIRIHVAKRTVGGWRTHCGDWFTDDGPPATHYRRLDLP